VDGIGRASEIEADVDPRAARGFLAAPSGLLPHAAPLLVGFPSAAGLAALVSLGGFRNRRQVFDWEGDTIELDETMYDHGTLYEIECETEAPEALRARLEAFLDAHGVGHAHCTSSKFKARVRRSARPLQQPLPPLPLSPRPLPPRLLTPDLAAPPLARPQNFAKKTLD
jgi:hypothetical protein